MAKKSVAAVAASSVDPFASAKRKASPASKAADANLIIAHDFTGYNGGKFSAAEVVKAVEGYCDGHTMFEEGKTMKDTNRPIIINLARTDFAQDWLMRGTRPKNPKVVTNPDGSGRACGVIFMDSSSNLDEDSYASLANLIGAANAEQLTIKRNDFTFAPELLEADVEVQKNGKVIKQNVLQAIKEALQEKFAPSPQILGSLFQVTPVFKTAKGLIDKGPQLVTTGKSPADAQRLAQFLEIGRFTTQLKPGASTED